jgi:predicted nucleotidyltransferase
MKAFEHPKSKFLLSNVINTTLSLIPDTIATYLYGSYAYGVPNNKSDYDIDVIVPDNEERNKKKLAKIICDTVNSVESLENTLIQLYVDKFSDFNSQAYLPTIEKIIVEKGVCIYGILNLIPCNDYIHCFKNFFLEKFSEVDNFYKNISDLYYSGSFINEKYVDKYIFDLTTFVKLYLQIFILYITEYPPKNLHSILALLEQCIEIDKSFLYEPVPKPLKG